MAASCVRASLAVRTIGTQEEALILLLLLFTVLYTYTTSDVRTPNQPTATPVDACSYMCGGQLNNAATWRES